MSYEIDFKIQDLNGLEFVRNLNNPPLVVFITAYAEYAVDSYKVQAVDYRYVRVELDDIVYIEGMNEYLKIKTVSGDPFLTHTTFRQMNEKLPENFLQAHRSYVVNMKHVKEIERSVILMTDGTHISISDSNKDTFMQYLQRHGLKK